MILSIRTDNPQAEIGLFANNGKQLAYKEWQAHRELSSTIHITIKQELDSLNKTWADMEGIIYYEGPGSFTGLRIGASVANAIASSNKIAIANRSGEDWIEKGLKNINQKLAVPKYGSDPHITAPKK